MVATAVGVPGAFPRPLPEEPSFVRRDVIGGSQLRTASLATRRATEADVPCLARLNGQLREDEGYRKVMTPGRLRERLEAMWQHTLTPCDLPCFAACVDYKIVT